MVFEKDKALKNYKELVWLIGFLGVGPPLTLAGPKARKPNGGPRIMCLNIKSENKVSKLIKYILSFTLNKYTFIITWKAEFLGCLPL